MFGLKTLDRCYTNTEKHWHNTRSHAQTHEAGTGWVTQLGSQEALATAPSPPATTSACACAPTGKTGASPPYPPIPRTDVARNAHGSVVMWKNEEEGWNRLQACCRGSCCSRCQSAHGCEMMGWGWNRWQLHHPLLLLPSLRPDWRRVLLPQPPHPLLHLLLLLLLLLPVLVSVLLLVLDRAVLLLPQLPLRPAASPLHQQTPTPSEAPAAQQPLLPLLLLPMLPMLKQVLTLVIPGHGRRGWEWAAGEQRGQHRRRVQGAGAGRTRGWREGGREEGDVQRTG